MGPNGAMVSQMFEPSQDEQLIAILQAEWANVQHARQKSKRLRRRQVVAEWEATICDLKAEQRDIEASGGWVRGSADLLSVIGRERRETYHSKVLAWLMDPLAPHGFGHRFLEAFLGACDAAWEIDGDLYDVRIRCEETRSSCRADIVVWTDTFTLIVENKIDAAEGPEQCDRIYTDFGGEIDPRFVFLSPSGRPPTSATGEAREHFRTTSYRVLKSKLTAIIEAERSGTAPGIAAAKGYLHTLNTLF